ncbi:hypothetical protein FACS1894123_11290 [Bacteroidia bacterium]|nr:hypothetical protein FACS1894123_11290 [Bacteroidia bacterium]
MILKDEEARNRYDIEYQRFKSYQRQQEQFRQQQRRQDFKQEKTENKNSTNDDYKVNDDVLNNWMNNAKKQSVGLAQQMIEELKGMVKEGAKAAGKEVLRGLGCLLIMIVIGILIGLIGVISKSCSNTTHSYQGEVVKSNVSTVNQAKPNKNDNNQSDKIKKIMPLTIPVDTFKHKSEYERILITNVGYISIPSNMELQSGNYKEFVESGQKLFAEKFHFEISDNRVVFQQKGLNNLEQKGFASYARIIIETEIGNQDDYLKQSDDFSMSTEELNSLFLQQVKQDFQGTGLHIIKWEGVSIVSINQSKAIKISYIRQLNDNPHVYVNMYKFPNNDRMHTITLSYRQEDSNIWKPLFLKVINSFNLI